MRKNIKYEYKGKLMTIPELMNFSMVSESALRDRINKLGWDIERALTEQVSKQTSKGLPSKSTVDAEISKANRKASALKLFAQCTARHNSK